MSSLGFAETYRDSVTFIRVIDGTEAPSCDVIKFRLQEHVKRNVEAESLLEWYSPTHQGPEQRKALLNVLQRMPSFLDDRFYEFLDVVYQWKVDEAKVERILRAPDLKTTFQSSKYGWKDPFNGTLPDGVKFEQKQGTATLSQRMSFERFCLQDSTVQLKLESGDDEVIFDAENDPGLL